MIRVVAGSLLTVVLLSSCSFLDKKETPDQQPVAPQVTTQAAPAKPSVAPLTAQPSAPAPTAAAKAVATPKDSRPFSKPKPLPQSLSLGMKSPLVRELQVRLRHAVYLGLTDVTDTFGEKTQTGVRNLQKENHLPGTGIVDQATWDVLLSKSYDPTEAELNNTNVGPWFTGPSHPAYMMEIQHRLKQAGKYSGAIDGAFTPTVEDAISAYRVSVGLSAGKVMDERAWFKLRDSTKNPSYKELFSAPPPAGNFEHKLDPRCTSGGKIACFSKEQKRFAYVVDGKVVLTREARFARPGWDSPKGDYKIWHKDKDVVSDIFGERTPMPYAMFFNEDRAIHFSDAFADTDYESGSHGCSQLRDYQVMKWLYDQLNVGDRVIVY